MPPYVTCVGGGGITELICGFWLLLDSLSKSVIVEFLNICLELLKRISLEEVYNIRKNKLGN